MKYFGDAFVVGCVNNNKAYEQYFHVGKLCRCLQDQYAKYNVGYEKVFDPKFPDTTLSQKISKYCFSIHKK